MRKDKKKKNARDAFSTGRKSSKKKQGPFPCRCALYTARELLRTLEGPEFP